MKKTNTNKVSRETIPTHPLFGRDHYEIAYCGRKTSNIETQVLQLMLGAF